MVNPLVTICVPNYNYNQFILDCILSCVHQDYENIEIIVVDDDSTDNSWEVLSMAMGFDDRLSIYRHETNKGYSAAKNTGIKATKGKYIVHLDADDMLTYHSITPRVKFLEENPECDMVHAKAYRFKNSRHYTWLLRKEHKLEIDTSAKIHAQTVMLRRTAFEKYGLFYEKMRSKADKEMWTRMQILGANIQKIDSVVAFYRKHDESMLAMRARNKKYDNMIDKMYNERVEQIKREGATKENTLWL